MKFFSRFLISILALACGPFLSAQVGTIPAQTYVYNITDVNGLSDLQTVYFLITNHSPLTNSPTEVLTNTCYLKLNYVASTVQLAGNNGTFGSAFAVGSSNTVSNSQCSIDVSKITVANSTPNTSVTVIYSFLPLFAGSLSAQFQTVQAISFPLGSPTGGQTFSGWNMGGIQVSAVIQSSTVQNLSAGGGGGSSVTLPATINLIAGNGSGGAANSLASVYASPSLSNFYLGNAAGNTSGTGTQNVIFGINAGTAITQPTMGETNQSDTVMGSSACPVMTTARESVCIGANAGFAYIGNGLGIEDGLSTFFGSDAGLSFPGTGTNDTDNLFLGQKSGEELTSGGSNLFLGNHAGLNVTTSSDSIFIGHAVAGNSADAGLMSNDIAIGPFALYNANGTNAGDVVIGYEAGYNQSAANDNVFIGVSAGFNNLTGTNNTSVGFSAGAGSTVAIDTTYVGWQTGKTSTGSFNTEFGAGIAPVQTSGLGNVLLGYDVANLLTSGSYNIIAGFQGGAIFTTGAHNILLGYTANGSTATDSQEIVIGDTAVGHGTLTTTIGIATTTATYLGGIIKPITVYSNAGTQLAACASGLAGSSAVVSDATSVTAGTAYSVSAGAGTVTVHVECTSTGGGSPVFAWQVY